MDSAATWYTALRIAVNVEAKRQGGETGYANPGPRADFYLSVVFGVSCGVFRMNQIKCLMT